MSNTETDKTFQDSTRRRRKPGPISRILDSVLDAGRQILYRRRGKATARAGSAEFIGEQCAELVQHRGEASGLALAREILNSYAELSLEEKWHFFEILLDDFSTDPDQVIQLAESYRESPDFNHLHKLSRAIESPRHKLFRRLNMVPGGTGALVRMRGELLQRLRQRPQLAAVDSDLKHLLIAWFNRGFLSLEHINWDSSARVLEKIIEYEAVHEIGGWSDLRGRLKSDRRLFAFLHPAMPDDPVIFVEIALGKGSAARIQPLLETDREVLGAGDADTATFYSISNCHAGLQGISFGNFLIKQVSEDLRLEIPGILRYETLSPVPGFRAWVERAIRDGEHAGPLRNDLEMVAALVDSDNALGDVHESVRDAFLRLCAHYLVNCGENGMPIDPVARFHLGNGASLDRINWAADTSATGNQRSFGIMVNYVYELSDIEKNHEAFFAGGIIAASGNVRKLAGV